jgi:hypothetical protein
MNSGIFGVPFTGNQRVKTKIKCYSSSMLLIVD